MKNNVKYLIVFISTFIPSILKAQPPCPPFSSCWCADHPMHPACRDIGIPISDWYGHIILIASVTLLVYIYTKKNNVKPKIKNNEK